jgi:uracil-DNA glycosylase family 4
MSILPVSTNGTTTMLSPVTNGMYQGPLCHQGTSRCRGFGNPEYGVMIVGIAPGRDEVQRGRPFVGASGKFMDSLLKMCDFPREQTYATNLICWWNNTPTDEEIADCNSRLVSEIREVRPKLIISLGQIVTSRFTGLPRKQKNLLGSVIWSEEFQCYVLTTRHPAGPLHAQNMSMAQDLIRDFDKIPMILEWPRDGSIAEFTYDVVHDGARAQAILDALPRDRNVVVDIETNSKTTDETDVDVFTEELLRVGFRWVGSDGRENVYTFRPSAWAGGLRFPDDVQWEFQFGVYDTMGLWRHLGQRLRIVEDLGLKSYCVDERSGHHGLKTLAREYQGAGWYDAELEPYKKTGSMHRLDPDIVDRYNSADVVYTGRTDPIIHEKMLREGTDRLYYDLLIPAYNVYRDAQFRGIMVDHRRLIALGWETWMPRWLEAEQKLKDDARALGFPGEININSYPQLRKLFFDVLGMEVKKKTKTGNASVDKEVMELLDHPYATAIREFRVLDGMMDYVFAIQNEIKMDGAVHPSAQFHTVRTGRRSYKRPPMQTIPQEYTVGAEYAQIEEVFVPFDRRTHGMLKADYEQIEVWMCWWASKDPTLLDHLLSGDIHSATAELAFKLDRRDYGLNPKKNPEWVVKRQGGKKLRFTIMYGGGAEKVSSRPPVGIGCTYAEARQFVKNFWDAYPVHAQWARNVERTAAKQGELVTPFGRKMHFPVILDTDVLRQAINFPIQSPASDHVLVSALELAERLREYNSYYLIDVHDAVWVEYDLRYEREVANLVREVMERPKFPDAPNVPVEIKVGSDIHNTHTLERESPWELQIPHAERFLRSM